MMNGLTWMIVKVFTSPSSAAAIAVAGALASACLAWATRRYAQAHRTDVRIVHMQTRPQTVTMACTAGILLDEPERRLDESECRRLMQRMWAIDPDTSRGLFGSPN